jgi:hypothetical protein
MLLLEKLGKEMVDSGFVSTSQIGEVSTLLDNPRYRSMNILFIAASGRKPKK